MSGAGFLRLKKLRGCGIIGKAARHNRRVIPSEEGTSGSIYPERSHLNETLQGPATADDVALLAKELMSKAGITKLRKDAVLGVEFVFSLPANHQLDEQAFFADCVEWVGEFFGGAILSADIHRDEAQEHCHVLMLPLFENRMNGSDCVGNKPRLLEIQMQFHKTVASRYGLNKAPAQLKGMNKETAVSAVLNHLKATSDPALRSAAWSTIREAIERNPGPMMLNLGIELPAPKKQSKSMTQIFTSKGRSTLQDKKMVCDPYRV